MKQGKRLFDSKEAGRNKMLEIVETDVESLLEDSDILTGFEKKQKNRIGF